MKDKYGRTIDYLRISITDRCNLRCRYCMPKGIITKPASQILSYEEILKVCEQAAVLGIRKVKITGGEPLVRCGAPELIGRIKRLPGIERVTITTNGVLLPKYLESLISQGLDGVNVSLDTLNSQMYERITGFDCLSKVMDGIEGALRAGLPVKINTVLQQDMSEREWEKLILLAREKPLDVRFIELMPIGEGKKLEGISNQELLLKLKSDYPDIKRDNRVHGSGPAIYYEIPGFLGSIGFISPIHGKFCESCNRIRLNAVGELKPCLCYGKTVDVKGALMGQNPEKVREALGEAIYQKPAAHCFEQQEKITEEKRMISIGG